MKLAGLFLSLGLLTSCNTLQGVGRDVSAGGAIIEDTAKITKRKAQKIVAPQNPAPVYIE